MFLRLESTVEKDGNSYMYQRITEILSPVEEPYENIGSYYIGLQKIR